MMEHEKALEVMKQLNEIQMFLVISELLTSDILRPDRFQTWCINHLHEKEQKRQLQISSMAIRLGILCKEPTDKNIEEAMRYMYDNKFHEGSKFGEFLNQKFKQQS